MLQIAPHFLIGLGPNLYHDFSRAASNAGPGPERTNLGFAMEMAGFFGGDEANDAKDSSITYEPTAGARFGSRGTWVFTAAADLSGSVSAFSTTEAKRSQLTIGPAVDYFVAEDLSIGARVAYSGSSQTGFQPDGSKVTYTAHGLSLFGRVGRNFQISDLISWYPSFGIGVSHGDFDERSGADRNAHDATRTWLSISLPVLAEIASHYFMGFGPFVSLDVSDSDPSAENLATIVGLSSTFGGWL